MDFYLQKENNLSEFYVIVVKFSDKFGGFP